MTSANDTVPFYMKQFSCIGSSCEDTCCAWWGISIDKRTYNQYQSVSDVGMYHKLKANLKIKPQGNDQDYAEMQLNPNTGDCSMLEGGLCTIQAKLGESYLSQTCRTYPRVVNQVGNLLETSAELSCPEAARLILLNPGAMEFVKAEPHSEGAQTIRHKAIIVHDPKRREFYLEEIRDMMMEILRYREFSLKHRLILLGVFCDNVNLLIDEKKHQEIPSLIQEFRSEVRCNEELRNYDVYPMDTAFQLQYLNNYLMGVLDDTIWNFRYRECINEYVKGMSRNGDSLEASVNTYNDSYERFIRPFEEEHPHLFENFFLNRIYSRLLAEMYQNIPVFDSYRMLIVEYAMIKMHMIGISAYHDGITAEMAVKIIQSYTKNYEHAAFFHKNIVGDLKKNGYDGLGYMSLLIKN